MTKVYQYLPDLKVLREKPLDESHYHGPLTTYPASGFGKEHEGRDLIEGKDFELKVVEGHNDWNAKPGVNHYAAPLEAEVEKQGNGMNQLFEYLIQYGGQIISSNDLSPDWINQARASNRMWVDEYGYGFVWEPFVNKLPETVEEVELFEKWFPLKVELPPDLTFENLQKRILDRKQRKLN